MYKTISEQSQATEKMIDKIKTTVRISGFPVSGPVFYMISLICACFLWFLPNTSTCALFVIAELGVTYAIESGSVLIRYNLRVASIILLYKCC